MRARLAALALSPSQTLLAFCFCFMAGVASASAWLWFWGEVGNFTVALYAGLVLMAGGAFIFWFKPAARFLLLAVFFFIFGLWRVAISLPDCTDARQICYWQGKKITVVGQLVREREIRRLGREFMLKIFTVEGRSAEGKIFISSADPNFLVGDWVRVGCTPRLPASQASAGRPSTPRPVTSEGVILNCGFNPVVRLLPAPLGRGSIAAALLRPLMQFRRVLAARVHRIWEEPTGSIVAGLLYGDQSGVPAQVLKDFNGAGITHIMAISGYNITIIASILLSTFVFLGLWRQQAIILVFITLPLFVLFSGASGSAVRAAIMGSLVLFARYLGEEGGASITLWLAAAAMALYNPFVLLYNAGFQLSFAATAGLIYLSPGLERSISKWGARLDRRMATKFLTAIGRYLVETLSATLAASVMTLPIVLWWFGYFSLMAPIANVLVLWLIPFIMFGATLAIASSMILFPLAALFGFITHLMIGILFAVARSAALVPVVGGQWRLPVPWLFAYYAIIMWFIHRKSKVSA